MLLPDILVKIKATCYIHAEHVYNLCKPGVKAEEIFSLFWSTQILLLWSRCIICTLEELQTGKFW